MFQLLAPLISPIISKVIDLIPNSNDRAKAKEDLEKGMMDAINTANAAQSKINEIEAKHVSLFVAGWRPFIGWVCGIGIAWSFVLRPMAAFLYTINGGDAADLPTLNYDSLLELVLAMLGLGGLRTYEKMKGAARSSWIKKNKGDK